MPIHDNNPASRTKEEGLVLTEHNMQLFLRSLNDILWEYDLIQESLVFSNRWKELTGYEFIRLQGSLENLRLLIHAEDQEPLYEKFKNMLQDNGDLLHSELRLKIADGSFKTFSCRSSVTRDSHGKPDRIVGTLEDISRRKELEEQCNTLKNFDPVTGLPNHKYMMDKLTTEMCGLDTNTQKGALLLIDLDDFKKLSDIYGLQTSNELLKSVGAKLKECIRVGDTVSRMDGDEFSILLSGNAGEEEAASVAKRVLGIFRCPFYVSGYCFHITASIGIIMFPEDCGDIADIFRNGNAATHRAKEKGKNQYQFFEKTMRDKLMRRYTLENELREAVQNNEFALFYQPVVHAETGRLEGLEVLIRWLHPEKGIISPADFIPVAEETGLIISIGLWVLETACAQNKSWQNKGYPSLRIAVNISSRQLQQRNFARQVQNILAFTGMTADFLELEITESAMMQSMDTAVRSLEQLKAIGIKVSLDDFGTSYSSLSYLKLLPIDKIKIDQTFIRDIRKDPKNEAIISAIVALAYKMKLELVAEGVETEEQMDFMIQQGCRLIQGYLFSRPLPLPQAEEIVKRSEIRLDNNSNNDYNI